MNQLKCLQSYVFRILLNLFPREFRADHGEEIQAVFDLEMEDAAQKGVIYILRRSLHELVDFPGAVIRQHLRQRRTVLQDRIILSDEPISRGDLLIGLGLFLLALTTGFDYFNFLPLLLIVLAFPVIVALIGIFKGFPRWALPSLGVVLSAFLLIGLREINLIWIRDLLVASQNELSRYIYAALSDGIFWISLTLLIFILFFLLTRLSRYRPFVHRLKQDWTLISFTLYGAIVVILLTSWDDYRYLERYKISAMVFLAVGAWGYLRSKEHRKRVIAMIAGVSMAMTTMAIGKWILVPHQNWAVWFSWHPPQTERWFESLGSLIELGWIVLALALPGLLGLFWNKNTRMITPPPKISP